MTLQPVFDRFYRPLPPTRNSLRVEHTDIKPDLGLGELKFGMDMDEVAELLGEPDEKETLEAEDEDDMDREIWHYDSLELTASFFTDEDALDSLAVSGERYTLNGEQIIDMAQDQLETLLEAWGVEEVEQEEIEEGEGDELLLICPEEGMSFWLVDGAVSEIQWGPVWEE